MKRLKTTSTSSVGQMVVDDPAAPPLDASVTPIEPPLEHDGGGVWLLQPGVQPTSGLDRVHTEAFSSKPLALSALETRFGGVGGVIAYDRDLFDGESERSTGSKKFYIVVPDSLALSRPLVHPSMRDPTKSQANLHFYEIIREKQPVRAYIDVDAKRRSIPSDATAAVRLMSSRDDVERRAIAFVSRRLNEALSRHSLRVVRAVSCEANAWRSDGTIDVLSIHITFIVGDCRSEREFFFADNTQFAAMAGLHRIAGADVPMDPLRNEPTFGVGGPLSLFVGDHFLLDRNVYDRDRNFRFYANTKRGERRPLQNARLYDVPSSGDVGNAAAFTALPDTTIEERERIFALTMIQHAAEPIAGTIFLSSSSPAVGSKRPTASQRSFTIPSLLPSAPIAATTSVSLRFALELLIGPNVFESTSSPRTFQEWRELGIKRLRDGGHVADAHVGVASADELDSRRLLLWAALTSNDKVARFTGDVVRVEIETWRERVVRANACLARMALQYIGDSLHAFDKNLHVCAGQAPPPAVAFVADAAELPQYLIRGDVRALGRVVSRSGRELTCYDRDTILHELAQMAENGLNAFLCHAQVKKAACAVVEEQRALRSLLQVIRGARHVEESDTNEDTFDLPSIDAMRAHSVVSNDVIESFPKCMQALYNTKDLKHDQRYDFAAFAANSGSIKQAALEDYVQRRGIGVTATQRRELLATIKRVYKSIATPSSRYFERTCTKLATICPYVGTRSSVDDIEDICFSVKSPGPLTLQQAHEACHAVVDGKLDARWSVSIFMSRAQK